MKQETLGEAAEKYVNYCAGYISENEDLADADRRGFIYGAKWQQEQMYSEEEFEILLETLSKVIVYQGNDYRLPHYFEFEIKEVIKQFKKK